MQPTEVSIQAWGGIRDYAEIEMLQRQFHVQVVAGTRPETILFGEHSPVITLGQNANLAGVLWAKDRLAQAGISLVRTDRGGEATIHEPGQLVVYPILNLGSRRLVVKSYIALLEDSVIELLDDLGLKASRRADYPGVWVGSKKICAVGIRITRRVSRHGLALNVSNSLSTFSAIVPCGITDPDLGVVTLHQAGITDVTVAEVAERLIFKLKKKLGCGAF